MLQKFLNLRRTDPTWVWLIVVLTLGLIFVIVIAMGLLFYIVRRKIRGRLHPDIIQIEYHGLLHLESPPREIKDKIYKAKILELVFNDPGIPDRTVNKRAKKVATRFEKQERQWALVVKRSGPKDHIKMWSARLSLNEQQKKSYESQIESIQNQQKILKDKMNIMPPDAKSAAIKFANEQTYALHNLNTIRTWNDKAIVKIKNRLDVLQSN